MGKIWVQLVSISVSGGTYDSATVITFYLDGASMYIGYIDYYLFVM